MKKPTLINLLCPDDIIPAIWGLWVLIARPDSTNLLFVLSESVIVLIGILVLLDVLVKKTSIEVESLRKSSLVPLISILLVVNDYKALGCYILIVTVIVRTIFAIKYMDRYNKGLKV